MSTHAVLGVRLPDGTISGCYVHYDGDTLKPRIQNFLRKRTTTCLFVLIKTAQTAGGMRSFHSPSSYFGKDSQRETDFLDDSNAYAIDERNWDEDHCGARHSYLVDYETGAIDGW